jgi:hypothetical protein
MPISINGSGTVTGISTGGISDTKAVADAAMPPGAILQVLQVVKTDTFSMSSVNFTDITGMSQAITFTAGNKILITFNGCVGYDEADQFTNIQLADSADRIDGAVAAAGGNRIRATSAARGQGNSNTEQLSFSYLDSPSGTSETYKVRMRIANAGRTSYLNRSGSDEDQSYRSRTISTLTLMEIQA